MNSPFRCVYHVTLMALIISCIYQVEVTTGAPSHEAAHSLQKRNAYQLCNVVATYTSRICTDYNDYGCFCGIGNMGDNPVDDVDRCCYEHDHCYNRVRCWRSLFSYFTTYTYECVGASCTCTDSLYDYPCARTVCQCDVELAECLARVQLNEEYMGYNRSANCRH